METAKNAELNITIDGCDVACARKSLEHIGISPVSYVLTDMGLVKGKTEINDEVIGEMVDKIVKDKDAADKADNDAVCCCCK